MGRVIQVNGKEIEMVSLTGEIIGYTKSYVQDVSSYIDYYGYVSVPRIVTNNNTVIEFFLKTGNKEIPVKLINHELSLRDGQKATLIWASRRGSDTMYLTRLTNLDTDIQYEIVNEATIRQLKLARRKTNLTALGFFLLLLLSALGITLLIFIGVRNFRVHSKTKRAIKALNAEATKMMSRIIP